MGNEQMWNIDCIVGARPNFVKIAPILRALRARGGFATRLIHTGQHYDVEMNSVFFQELGILAPDVNLEVGSGTGTEQTARIMLGLEPVLTESRPDMLLVVGDVNSTLAATLVAAKLLIPTAHVEAGLRSNDRTMPEEINRLVVDRLCDLLLTTEEEAAANLLKEGVAPDRIHFVGNVMIDTLRAFLPDAVPFEATLSEHAASTEFLSAARQTFGFVTLHRPSNVDEPGKLRAMIEALAEISRGLPLVFALHPRTKANVAAHGLSELLTGARILVVPPLSYLRALGMMRSARIVITDSGGVQEETTALGVPCLTVRDNTERPITITQGTNTLVGTSPAALVKAARAALGSPSKTGRIPVLWDGKTADRIAMHIETFLTSRPST